MAIMVLQVVEFSIWGCLNINIPKGNFLYFEDWCSEELLKGAKI